MSFWDKYLAPGDLRRQQQSAAAEKSAHKPKPVQRARLDPNHRARRQNGLLFGGIAFSLFSIIIARRAVARKHIQMRQFDQSVAPPASKVDGSFEAAEALGVATLVVSSVAMAGVGGAIKYFDIGDLEDLREQVRKGAGFDEETNAEADREIEGWIADVLSRKDNDGNLNDGIQGRLLRMAQDKVNQKRTEKQQEKEKQQQP